MKKGSVLMMAAILGCMAGAVNVWADEFPYVMSVESQDIMEDYLYLTLVDVNLSSEECAELEAGVNHWASERKAETDAHIEQLKVQAQADAEELGEYFYGYNIYQQMKVVRADERVLSLLENGYEYLGDAVASSYLKGINFDVQSGEILELADVINDTDGFKADATAYILEYANQNLAAEFLDLSEEKLNELWDNEMEWYMNASGIVAVFGENTLGTPELGIVEIPLTFEDFSSYIEEAYLLDECAGLYQMKENIPAEITAGEEVLQVTVQTETLEYETEYVLNVNEQSLDLGQFFYVGNMYLLKNDDDNVYVLCDTDTAVGDYMTHLYKISNAAVEKTDEVYGSIDSANSTPDSIAMGLRIYALGEYQASNNFSVDKNGKFEAGNGLYVVQGDMEYRYPLVTTVDLPAVVDGKDTTIPAGSTLKMIATDNTSKVKVYVTEMEAEAELEFKKGNGVEYWKNKVCGILEEECIETLPYVE